MLNENLKALRTARGYTQEELAIKLNVVRQTVSKWEKGLSVPDADMLSKIADILESDVSQLLGEKINCEEREDAVAVQLAKVSEQLAVKNRRAKRIWKVIIMILSIGLVVTMFSYLLFKTSTCTGHSTVTVFEESDSDIWEAEE